MMPERSKKKHQTNASIVVNNNEKPAKRRPPIFGLVIYIFVVIWILSCMRGSNHCAGEELRWKNKREIDFKTEEDAYSDAVREKRLEDKLNNLYDLAYRFPEIAEYEEEIKEIEEELDYWLWNILLFLY